MDPIASLLTFTFIILFISFFIMFYDSEVDDEKVLPIKDIKLVCHNCNSEQNKPEALFCFNCGEDLYPKDFKEIIVCPECNKEYDESYNYCDIDGAQLVEKNVEVQKLTKINKKEESVLTKDEFKSDFRKDTFTFGKFLIALSAFQGCLLIIIFIFDFQTDMIPDRLTALFTSIPIIIGTYGLYKRRIYGLYLVYLNYTIAILFAIFNEDLIYPARAVIAIGSGLIIFYFIRRSHLFTVKNPQSPQ